MESIELYGRRTVPAAVRAAVIDRDGMICRRCDRAVVRLAPGESYRPDALHLDHVIPWAEGGDDSAENLIVSCADCNLRRPRPQNVTRQQRVALTCADGEFHWPTGYEPPRVTDADERYLRSLPSMSRLLGAGSVEVLYLILNGHLAASRTSPVRVEVPDFVREDIDRRREEARLERIESQRRAVSGPRGPRPPKPAPVPTPEAVAYWRGLIDARRARERAAREARRAAR